MSSINFRDWLTEKLQEPEFRAEYEKQAPMYERVRKRYKRHNMYRLRYNRARRRAMRAWMSGR